MITDKDLELLGVRPVQRQPNHMRRATIAGLITAVLGAFLWKWIALTFGYEYAIAAIAIGFVIGFVVVNAGGDGVPMAIITVCLVVFAIFLGKFWMYYDGIMTATEAFLADERYAALARLHDDLGLGNQHKSQFKIAWDNLFEELDLIDLAFIAAGGVTAFRIVSNDEE